MMLSRFLLIFTFIFAVSACSTFEEKEELSVEGQSAEEIYNSAQAASRAGEYKKAAELYNEVERLYPYSDLASKAQLNAAKAYYDEAKYDEAIIALERYIQLYPGNEELDYAYYLRAICYYDQITNVERDQELTQAALEQLNLLIRRFPESDYSRDAMFKRDLAIDHLAGKEMEIGRYYLTRGYYQASINRFLNVVREYQTTTHVPEAMHRLVEAYLALGIPSEAYRVAVVLGHNYPGSDWYLDTYKLLDPAEREKLLAERSMVDKTIERIFRPQ